MPTLSATDGATTQAIEQIKRVDLTPEDVRKMSDEELAAHLAIYRKMREGSPPKAGKSSKSPKTPSEQLIDDTDVENNY